jgi:hypothetical protein
MIFCINLTFLTDYVYFTFMQSLRQHTLFLVLICVMLSSGITASYCYDVSNLCKDLVTSASFISQDTFENKLHKDHHEELYPELPFELFASAIFLTFPILRFSHADQLTLVLPSVFFEIFVPPQKNFNALSRDLQS